MSIGVAVVWVSAFLFVAIQILAYGWVRGLGFSALIALFFLFAIRFAPPSRLPSSVDQPIKESESK